MRPKSTQMIPIKAIVIKRPAVKAKEYTPACFGSSIFDYPPTYATINGIDAMWQGLNITLTIPHIKHPAAAVTGLPAIH